MSQTSTLTSCSNCNHQPQEMQISLLQRQLYHDKLSSLLGSYEKDNAIIHIQREGENYVFKYKDHQEYIQIFVAGQYLIFDLSRWKYGHRQFIKIEPTKLIETNFEKMETLLWKKICVHMEHCQSQVHGYPIQSGTQQNHITSQNSSLQDPSKFQCLEGKWLKEDGNILYIKRHCNDYVFKHEENREFIHILQCDKYMQFEVSRWKHGHRLFIRSSPDTLIELNLGSVKAFQWIKQK
eukprot:403344757